MVARRILVPPVRVRILPRQRRERAKSLRFSSFFFFTLRANVKNCIFDTYLILFQNFSLHHTPQKYQLNGAQTILEYRLLEFLSAKIS